jgi:hypothetical protein
VFWFRDLSSTLKSIRRIVGRPDIRRAVGKCFVCCRDPGVLFGDNREEIPIESIAEPRTSAIRLAAVAWKTRPK